MSKHEQLGAYATAVSNFDIAVAGLHRAHKDLIAKAAALPVQIYDDALASRLSMVLSATTLGLADHYSRVVVPAVKGA